MSYNPKNLAMMIFWLAVVGLIVAAGSKLIGTGLSKAQV